MNITILGRRWRDANGNTYHTATIDIDGEEWGTTPIEYGYDDHYLETALEALEADLVVQARGENDSHAAWYWLREQLGHNLSYSAVNVKRKKDL